MITDVRATTGRERMLITWPRWQALEEESPRYTVMTEALWTWVAAHDAQGRRRPPGPTAQEAQKPPIDGHG